jgi:hypothetical protein
MKRLFVIVPVLTSILLAIAILQFPPLARAQQQKATASADKPLDVDRIIRAFTAKETEFRRALNDYSFTRDATIQTIGMGGQVTGEYHRVSSFVFDDKGTRFEKISYFPVPTLQEISVTAEDIDDLGGVQPFALEASKINLYNFTYVGKERIDEIDTYVFDVAPKTIPDPKNIKDRYFKGRIWVDDRDLQIVKVRGKGVPENDRNRFPTFETYREQIDGKYWFPTYTYADDILDFPKGPSVHIRMLVRYKDFQRFRSEVKITEIDEPVPAEKPAPAQPPVKPRP